MKWKGWVMLQPTMPSSRKLTSQEQRDCSVIGEFHYYQLTAVLVFAAKHYVIEPMIISVCYVDWFI